MKARKSTVLPLVLLAYLGIMSYIGYSDYAAGHFTPLYYFGIIGASLLVIILLHFSLRRREKLAAERKQDISADAKTPTPRNADTPADK